MITLLFGGITHHYISPKLNYCNRINNVGTIRHNYVSVLVGNNNFKAGVIKGTDSACGKITGMLTMSRLSANMDLVVGGYNTNFREFRQRNIRPPSINGVTPVLGLNYRIPLNNSEKVRISLDTFLAFGIISHALSVTF